MERGEDARLANVHTHCAHAKRMKCRRSRNHVLWQVIAVARTCNLIFICLDVMKPLTHKKIIENELEGFGIRINKSPPKIKFNRKDKGGINLSSVGKQDYLDLEQVRLVLAEYKCHCADVRINEENCTVDDLIDVIEGNRVSLGQCSKG